MQRDRQPELMDSPDLDEKLHRHALSALWKINRVLGIDQSLHTAACKLGGSDSISILDLGTGGGGYLAYAAKQQNGDGDSLRVGLDMSTVALTTAQQWTNGSVRCVAGDVRGIPLADNSIDVVVCSLLLHHFDEDDVVAIMREAARVARHGVVFGDLYRSRTAFAVTWVATRIASRSPVFHTDGPRSVRAAYRDDELGRLADEAGLTGRCVRRRFPFRMIMTWRKSSV